MTGRSVLWRYFRRRGLRWGIWGVRMSAIAVGVSASSFMLNHDPSGWAMVSVIAVYGIHEIASAIRKSASINITQLAPQHMEITEGTFSLATSDLDKAVERLVAANVGKKAS